MSPERKNVRGQSFHLWLGHKFHLLDKMTKAEGKGGLGSQASGCTMLTLGVFWMTHSKTISLHFIWDLHPSITSIKGLIFSQALSHLLDTKKLQSFPAKYIPTCIFIDINHLQNHSFLQLSLFYLLTPFLL